MGDMIFPNPFYYFIYLFGEGTHSELRSPSGLHFVAVGALHGLFLLVRVSLKIRVVYDIMGAVGNLTLFYDLSGGRCVLFTLPGAV